MLASLVLPPSKQMTAVAVAALAALGLGGCAIPSTTTQLVPGPEPIELQMTPTVLYDGQYAELLVRSPGADSIVVESENGYDRFWKADSVLGITLPSTFGELAWGERYAPEWRGHTLPYLKKPIRIAACREGRCREAYHEITVKLPERNRRVVAVSAGWSSVFARRTIRGGGRTVLFREALTSGAWSLQGEWSAGGWNGRVQGLVGADDQGFWLDLSRMLKAGEGMSYGLAMHAGFTQSDWMAGSGTRLPTNRPIYRAGIGPSVMVKGITVSTQYGIYTDGVETLQIGSSRVSVNGNLTSIRQPVTFTAEKTFAFGGGAIVSRRRDAVERLTAAIRVVEGFAVQVGLSSRRIAWPTENPADDLRASDTSMILGGQYSLTW
jgi:hypothetical protein